MGARRIADVDWKRWRAVEPATLLFVLRAGQILLIRKRRGLGAGKVNGPGGRLEPGESPLECAVRELREEVRAEPQRVRFAGENRFLFTDGYSIHVHIFTAEDCSGEPQATAEALPFWCPVDRIPYREMWVDDVLWFPALLEGRRFSGWFIFEGDAMLDYALQTYPNGGGVLTPPR